MRNKARTDTKRYFFLCLDFALQDQNWEEVTYLRSRIKTMLQEDLDGLVTRSRTKEHAEEERGSIYHLNREVKQGNVCNLS